MLPAPACHHNALGVLARHIMCARTSSTKPDAEQDTLSAGTLGQGNAHVATHSPRPQQAIDTYLPTTRSEDSVGNWLLESGSPSGGNRMMHQSCLGSRRTRHQALPDPNASTRRTALVSLRDIMHKAQRGATAIMQGSPSKGREPLPHDEPFIVL